LSSKENTFGATCVTFGRMARLRIVRGDGLPDLSRFRSSLFSLDRRALSTSSLLRADDQRIWSASVQRLFTAARRRSSDNQLVGETPNRNRVSNQRAVRVHQALLSRLCCARMTWDDIETFSRGDKKLRIKGLDGSANGNRTEWLPVQLSSVRSICLQSRPTGIAIRRHTALRIRDVVTRLSLGGEQTRRPENVLPKGSGGPIPPVPHRIHCQQN